MRRGIAVADEVIAFLAARSGGDARTALNALELAWRRRSARRSRGHARPTPRTRCSARRCSTTSAGDQHYDYISAWIKSTRGSDPDASLYYLAAMLEGGEDPRFIARRMIILASEDIGNADPQALPIAVAAAHAVEHVGLPEAQFALAQAAIYLSLAPKSDAAEARARRGPRPHPRGRRQAARRRRCARRPTRRRASSAAARATTTRTGTPATSTTRSTCPRASRTCASTSPTTASPRPATGSPRCARRGVARSEAGRGG